VGGKFKKKKQILTVMDKVKLEETKKPSFWINDYWTVWTSPAIEIAIAKGDNKTDLPIKDPLKTFKEYIAGKEYYGQKCDLGIIPQQFIHRTDRLVKMYNHLITQEKIDLNKLEKVVDLARKVIYRYKKPH
jgi:hypothetical protein